MKKIYLLPAIFVCLLYPGRLKCQESDSTITLLFAGDIMGHEMQISSAYDDSTGTYSYDSVFKYIAPVIKDADFAIGNLEVTLGGAPYKGYPAFSSPDALASACRNAGFDVLVTANNHSADRGNRGVARTISVLDSLEIRHTGTWLSSEARDTLTPLLMEGGGMRIALLNYTYGTNGITIDPPQIVSYIDTVRIASDIIVSKAKGADFVIVFLHWGNEYDSLPSARQQKIAEFIFRSGAELIIGSHPHVVQPMETLADSGSPVRAVVWSMGNFLSNQRQRGSDGGAVVKIELTKSRGDVRISDAGYILTWVYTPTEKGKRRFYILPCSEFEDRPDFFQSSFNHETMKVFIDDTRKLLYAKNRGFNELISTGAWWITVAQ